MAFLAITDMHAGFRMGLLDPDTVLYDIDEEGNVTSRKPELNSVQKYLNELNNENIRSFSEWIGDTQAYMLYLGDPTQGNKYYDEVVEPSPYNQVQIAYYNLKRWLDIPNFIGARIATGTDSHELGDGSSSQFLTNELAHTYPKMDIKIVQHGLLEHNGITIDYAHHGDGKGIRIWTYGNIAGYSTKSMMMRELLNGNKPPDFILRGHRHVYVNKPEVIHVGDMIYETRSIVVPSMCWMSNFARKVSKSEYEITNGVFGVMIKDGFPFWKFFGRTIDMRTKETI